jgi:hypothetical protein
MVDGINFKKLNQYFLTCQIFLYLLTLFINGTWQKLNSKF